MAQTDAKKQEFIAAFTTVAAFFAERLYEGGIHNPSFVVQSPPEAEEDQLLSRKAVCDALDISPRTLDRYARTGKLQPVRQTGRFPKFRKSDVQALIKKKE
jgi:hypothetical protein